MINTIIELLQYSFIQRAIIAGIFLGILCAVLGVLLVLRRMSLIGDGLSHIAFGAIALGLWLSWYPIGTAIPLVIIGALGIQYLSRYSSAETDTVIGILSSFGISIGVILASLGSGFNVDIVSYLFGNILAISPSELVTVIVLSGISLGIVIVFYYELMYLAFDEDQALVAGVKTGWMQSILSIITAVTVVLAIRMVGVMLVSALIILPASTALLISAGFGKTLVRASLISVGSILIGIMIAFGLNLPPGATIVVLNTVLFGATVLIKNLG